MQNRPGFRRSVAPQRPAIGVELPAATQRMPPWISAMWINAIGCPGTHRVPRRAPNVRPTGGVLGGSTRSRRGGLYVATISVAESRQLLP